MKRIIFIVVLFYVILSAGMLWADISAEPDIGLTNTTGYFAVVGNSDTDWGTFAIYYDGVKNTMAIRIRGKGATSVYYHCYKNSNPELYNTILTFMQKSIDGWQTYNQRNGDGTSSHFNNYKYINLWYKSEGGKNIIKGFSFQGGQA